MNFRLWGTINEIAGGGPFFVTVSAICDDDPAELGSVETAEASTHAAAEDLCQRLVVRLGAKLRGEGHQVVDVEAL